jgi:hypothetical protein
MANSTQSEVRFVYYIPLPALSKAVAIGYSAFLLSIFLYLPYKLGLEQDPLFWLLLVGMLGLPIAFFLVLAFPPRSWHARLEIQNECIRLVPKPVLRWIGEPSTVLPIAAQASEVLVLCGSQDNLKIGFRLSVRSTDGSQRDLKVETASRLSAHQAKILCDGITSATGLLVRLIKRERGKEGGVEEMPWIPGGWTASLPGLAKLVFAATPFIGGIVVGCLRPNLALAAVLGLALWLCQTLALFAYSRFSKQESKFPTLYWFSTLFTFAASYAFTFVFVFYVFRPK